MFITKKGPAYYTISMYTHKPNSNNPNNFPRNQKYKADYEEPAAGVALDTGGSTSLILSPSLAI